MSLPAIPLHEVIGITILHSLWQITLLWIVLVAVLRLWPRAYSAVRYALAISTLMLAVLVTGATAVYEWQSQTNSKEIAVGPNDTTQAIDTVHITVRRTLLSRMVDAMDASVPVLAWLWCAGLVVMGARFGGSFFYLRTLRAQPNISPIAPVWEKALQRLSRSIGLRCEVTLATSARIFSPLTLGSISPIILLPAGLLSGLSTAQIEAVLVHELYHIKRRDYIINICQALVEVMLFYHPAIWHMNRIIREERENCCDDQTVAFCGDAVSYARALTRIQEMNTSPKPRLAMSAGGSTAGNFTYRIQRLFHAYPHPSQARSKGIFATGFLLVYLGIVLVSAVVSTARPVKVEKALTKDVNDHNALHILSADTISMSHGHTVPDKTASTPKQGPLVRENVRSTAKQRADTTVRQQSLSECLQKVNLLLKMAALYRPVADSLRFRKLSAWDSLLMTASTTDLRAKSPFKLRSGGFYGTVNLSRLNRLESNDSKPDATKQDEPISHDDIQESAPLYIIDGVRVDQTQSHLVLNQLNGANVSSITVYKGQDAIALYGDKGKDGVVVIRLKPGTSIEEFTKSVFVQVYPNATDDRLNITFTPPRHGSRVKMILLDSEGRVVKEITDSVYDNTPTELHVDITDYRKGIYILQINIDGIRSQQRVVVE